MKLLLRVMACSSLLVCVAGTAPGTGTLTIEVANVRAARGHVRLDLCPEGKFLSDDCPWHGSAPAQFGTTSVTISGVPAGRYAVQAYLDENDNDRVDRALFGIPREGIGFSNDAKIVLGPPKFREAAFAFNGVSATLRLKLRYFLGAPGPQG
jgi:uncharacterized protein (DUF2141 family)